MGNEIQKMPLATVGVSLHSLSVKCFNIFMTAYQRLGRGRGWTICVRYTTGAEVSVCRASSPPLAFPASCVMDAGRFPGCVHVHP